MLKTYWNSNSWDDKDVILYLVQEKNVNMYNLIYASVISGYFEKREELQFRYQTNDLKTRTKLLDLMLN